MEGDIRTDDEMETQQNEQNKQKCDDEVKIPLDGSKEQSTNELRKDISIQHEVNYNFRNKYKHYHNREYGVYYHRDYTVYNYRGYEIREPKVCSVVQDAQQPMRWVQYMTHAEKHPRKPPRMYYNPNDNTFVQIILMSLFGLLLFTLVLCLIAFYADKVQQYFKDFNCIWIPGVFGIVFTIYLVLCTACSRIFPISLILLIINVFSTCLMCMYVTAIHETHGVILALICIILTVLFLIVLALRDINFRRFKLLLFTGLVSWIFSCILVLILRFSKESWLPDLRRRENMIVFGIVVYCLSLILMLQLIIADRTVQLADDEYAAGTFMLYMCIPCLFMKLVAYLGLYEENR